MTAVPQSTISTLSYQKGPRIKCRYELRQTKHFDKMFRERRGGGDAVNSPLMEGRAETPEEWLARVAQSRTEVRNFR